MADSTTSDVDYRRMFDALPNQYIVVDPELTVVAATDSFLAATLKERDNAIGHNIIDVFPDNPDDPTADGTKVLKGSLEQVLETKEKVVLPPQRYDMELTDGSYEVRYWQPLNVPVFGPDGDVIYVMHGAEDITAQMTEGQN